MMTSLSAYDKALYSWDSGLCRLVTRRDLLRVVGSKRQSTGASGSSRSSACTACTMLVIVLTKMSTLDGGTPSKRADLGL